jgi:orotate phosphoribosyltransferase
MNPEKMQFIRFLVDSGCLKFGDFQLKSGDRSPFFVNLGQADSGAKLDVLGRALAETVRTAFPQSSLLFGPAYKGIALAVAAAASAWYRHGKDVRFFYDRKEAKAHGERGKFVGHLPEPGEPVVMIDDVLSDGGTKVEAVAAIEAGFQTRPVGIVVALDRRRRATPLPAGLPPVQAVIGLADLCDYLEETGDPTHLAALRRFFEGEK